jgi:prolyl oligopeptidase
MEDSSRAADVSAWVRAASAHTTAQLAALPVRERLAERIQSISRSSVAYSSLYDAGTAIFYLRLDPDSSVPKLVVRAGGGDERVLFDPATIKAPPTAINNYTPSPSGRLVAIHTAEGGAEVGRMRFMNVATGEWLPEELAPIWGEFYVSWLDEDTVLYTRMAVPAGDDPLQNLSAFVHHLGHPVSEDSLLLGAGVKAPPFESQEMPTLAAVPISDWTLGVAGGARADARIFMARNADLEAGKPAWKDIAGYDDRINAGDMRGDALYLLTTRQTSNGTLVALDLKAPSLARAQILLEGGKLVLQSFVAAMDGLYVSAMEDGVARLLYLPDAKGIARPIALPFDGTLGDLRTSLDGRRATFSLEGWLDNKRYFEVEGGKLRELGVCAETWSGAHAFTVRREEATSADGTHVPLTILSPRNVALSGRNPTILTAYGSYGISNTPVYSPQFLGWLDNGGVYAVCHVRGGGERGREWHEGGRAAKKPNGHADFIACAERVIELGDATPATLGAFGSSAAGLRIAPAALKRPDLFAAVVPRVAILNPTRLAVAENGPNQFAEMGDPGTEAGFQALYEEDSYLWLDRAKASPDWLLPIGLNDKRVEPWMSAKFAAKALAKFGEGHLVLVRTDPEAGHGIGSTRDQVIEERADIYAFFLDRFRMTQPHAAGE